MSLRRSLLYFVAVAACVFSVMLVAFAVNLTGILMPRRSLDEQVALIASHTETRVPEGVSAAVPTVIMLHGCGGRRQVQDDYAEQILAAGYAVMIVSSNEARGIGRFASMSQVCLAMRLLGQERAADIHAAIEIARDDQRLDADRIALLGWSHGGWTILDALSFAGGRADLPSLTGASAELPGVRLAVTMYPYCGFPARTSGRDLPTDIPIRSVLAEKDVIAPPDRCERRLRLAETEGLDVEITWLEGQTHAFDEPAAPALDPRIVYNENAAAIAQRRVVDWLNEAFADQG